MRGYDDDPGGSIGAQFGAPRVPTVTRRLLWINLVLGLAFLLLTRVPGIASIAGPVYSLLGLDVSAWREWFPFLPVWQVASYGFLHSVSDPLHLLFNMLGLYFFGGMLEQLVGARRFLLFYLASIVVGGVAQLALSLALGQGVFVVGASGAILFLVVAMAVLRPRTPVLMIFVPMQLWVIAVIYVALDLFGLLGSGGNTAHMVHLGGAAFGFAAAKLGWLWFDPLEAWASHKAEKQVEDLRSDEQKLDELLARIHREGIGSLSSREREFLKRMSARRGG